MTIQFIEIEGNLYNLDKIISIRESQDCPSINILCTYYASTNLTYEDIATRDIAFTNIKNTLKGIQ